MTASFFFLCFNSRYVFNILCQIFYLLLQEAMRNYLSNTKKIPSKKRYKKSPVKHIVQDEPKPKFGKFNMVINVESPL